MTEDAAFEGAIQAALAAADPEFDFGSFNALYVVAMISPNVAEFTPPPGSL